MKDKQDRDLGEGKVMSFFNIFVDVYLWPLTLTMIVLSLATVVVLIVMRLVREAYADIYLKRRQEIRATLLLHLSNPLKNINKALIKNKRDMRILAQEAPKILRNFKGTSRAQLLDAFEAAGLYDWALKDLESKTGAAKLSAIYLIAHRSNAHIKQKLTVLQSDPDHLVRYAAIEAMALMRDPQLLPQLVASLSEQPDQFSIPLMAGVFKNTGGDLASSLEKYLQADDTPAQLKAAMMMAILQSGNASAIRDISLQLCFSENDALRTLAFQALSHSSAPVDRGRLEAGMADKDWRVRQYVASCAAHSDPIPADILRKLLQDENWLVGMTAGEVLRQARAVGLKLLQVISEQDTLAGSRARKILAKELEIDDSNYGTSRITQ